jgi:hypothetical protein
MLHKEEVNELTEKMVDLRASGASFAQIAVKTGYPAEECAARVHDYLTAAYSSTSVVEMRMLQGRRLEMIMNALWQQVMQGDLVLEGKGAANLISAIDKVTELLDLKKDRLRDEQVQLTRAQSHLIMATLDQVRLEMLDRVLSMVKQSGAFAANSTTSSDISTDTNSTEANSALSAVNSFRAIESVLTQSWDGVFAEVTERAMQENESVTVQMGPGAKEIEA